MPEDTNTVDRPDSQAGTASVEDSSATRFPDASAEPPPPPGSRYALGPEIARGGVGEVYRATDAVLNREVAVKVLQPRYGPASAAARRFADEARITAQLQHPGIPPVHDLGTLPDGRPFLAMKLIKGDTLDQLLTRRPDLAAERGRLIAVFEQICQAVGYAHARHVLHRDLKPQNVMVGAFGDVQVMDWGLAKLLTAHDREGGEADPGAAVGTEIKSARDSEELLTQAGSVLGTPAYMPPEQAIGAVDQIDRRSDVFGLGGILAAILTGQPPFVGATGESTRQMAAKGKTDECFARLDVSGADPEMVALCKRCLSAEKEGRPADAGEVAKAVAALRQAADERARRAEVERAEAGERRKRRRVQVALAAAAAGLLAAAGVGVGVALLWRQAEHAKDEAVVARDEAERAKAAEGVERQKAEDARERLEVVEYGRTVQVAYQEWRENNVAAARVLLESTRPDLRGWEWHYVHRLTHAELVTVDVPPSDAPHSPTTFVGFSKDGSQLITSRGIGEILVQWWDTRTGRSVRRVKGPSGEIVPGGLSPDGKRLVVSVNRTPQAVVVLDAETGAEQLALTGHKNSVGGAAFTPDGKRVLTLGRGENAVLWDSTSGKKLLELKVKPYYVCPTAFSPDSTRVAITADDGTVRAFDTDTGAELYSIKGNAPALAFSPDGTRLAVASYNPTVKICDARTGAEVLTLTGHAGGVSAVAYTPDGKFLATGSGDQTARVWDAATGEEVLILRGHTRSLTSVAFSPDGKLFATGGYDGARVWDATAGAVAASLKLRSGGATAAAFNSDGTRVAVWGTPRKSAVVYDKLTNKAVSVLGEHSSWVNSAVFSPDGRTAATGSTDGTVIVWDVGTGAELVCLVGHRAACVVKSFSPDGSRLVTTSARDKTLHVWDVTTGKVVMTTAGGEYATTSASFSPDGRRFVTAGIGERARVWDLASGAEVLALGAEKTSSWTAAFSPDGRRIVAGAGNAAKVWDADTGRELLTLTGHTAAVKSAAFSPDGRRIVTGGEDGMVRVWEAATGAQLLSIRGEQSGNEVHSVSFTPDGTRLISGGSADARVWDSRPFPQTRGEGDGFRIPDQPPPHLRPKAPGTPRSSEAFLMAGSECESRGDLTGAAEAYRQAIRLDPEYAEGHYLLGQYLERRKDPDGAIACYREATRCDPKFGPGHHSLGRALLAAGDADAAVARLADAVRLQPHRSQWRFDLARAYAQAGSTAEAVAAYRKVIEQDPRNRGAHNNLGVLLKGQGDLAAAAAAFREAVRVDPAFALGHANLGDALVDQGQFDDAVASYTEAERKGHAKPDIADRVRRAERLKELLPRLPDVLAGRAESKSPGELCEFAELCAKPFQKRHADGVSLYERAFASDPKLLDDRGSSHRYNAACSAALAAFGTDVGVPAEPDTRAKLRGKVMVWLRADLDALRKLAASPRAEDRQRAVVTLTHWLRDTDLAGTRPGAPRDGFSPAEKEDFDALWANVKATLADARKPLPREVLPPPREAK